MAVWQLHAELDAALDHANLAGRDLENTQLSNHAQSAQLRNDQHLPIGVVEEAVRHALVGHVDVNREPGVHLEIAVAAERAHTLNKVRGFFRNLEGTPAQLIRRGRNLFERRPQ